MLSTTKVEYISATNCCTQLLWIRNHLEDYDVFETNIPIFCDNSDAISLLKNTILHSRAKDIDLQYCV